MMRLLTALLGLLLTSTTTSLKVSQSKNVWSIQQQSREFILNRANLLITVAVSTAAATIITPKRVQAAAPLVRIPTAELQTVFAIPVEWEAELVSPDNFARLDENDDSIFYEDTRFVEHIDMEAVKSLENFHRIRLNQLSQVMYGDGRKVDVLDLCSSWTSHLPKDLYPDQTVLPTDIKTSWKVAGLGMNMKELQSNKQLTEYVRQDLNKGSPTLPWKDATFDAVLLQLSIDYLTKPTMVLREACRVLRPGGEIIISFSNRLFFDKAIAGWTGKSDIEHVERVGNYLHYSSPEWREPFTAMDLLPPSSSSKDPLYAVIARKI